MMTYHESSRDNIWPHVLLECGWAVKYLGDGFFVRLTSETLDGLLVLWARIAAVQLQGVYDAVHDMV